MPCWPLVQDEVARHGWMTIEELVNFIAVSESTPGPFAVNVSTYVGAETGGIAGALSATLGVVLPSFIIILLVARCFDRFQKSRIIKGCMTGLRPAVVGMMRGRRWFPPVRPYFPGRIFSEHGDRQGLFMLWPDFPVMLLLSLKKVHPIAIILLSALLGIGAGYLPV